MPAKQSDKVIKSVFIAAIIGVFVYLGLAYLSNMRNKEQFSPTSIPNNAGGSELDSHLEKKANLSDTIPDTAVVSPTADEVAQRMGMDMKFDTSKDLVAHIMKQVSQVDSEKDIENLARVLGNGKVNSDQLHQLNKLYQENRIRLRDDEALELLGEIKVGRSSRWLLHLSDDSKIQLQTTKQRNGKWKIDQVTLPQSSIAQNGVPLTKEQMHERDTKIEAKDAMMFSNNFLKALMIQDFARARVMANRKTVSDAKIAGLCILFEDGAYNLNEKKPLQALRIKEQISSFYVNLKASDDSDAQFSINTLRDNANTIWKIQEVNLDRLLEDYANRVAGGDVFYAPLIKNPDGGDMLVIYFDFDSEGLAQRTKQQLNIVASLLQLDSKKKVRLSGHTDGQGSSEYNQGLSENRVQSVKKYLTSKGINAGQIITEAHGFNKPIRSEEVIEGIGGNSRARRANRRTEIYLDF